MLDLRLALDAANDARMCDEFHREVAEGRVLLEVHVDEQNEAAVERLVLMLGSDARKFVIGEPKTSAALPD